MKAVKYPIDPLKRLALKNRYIAALSVQKTESGISRLDYCQKEWKNIRRKLPQGKCFPSDIRKILKAEYSKLIGYYNHYIKIENAISEKDKDKLKFIFSYDIFHDAIAGFFMDASNDFDLRVCHYCGISYINKYSVSGDAIGLERINYADKNELGKLLHIKTPKTLQSIYDHQPYVAPSDFNHVVRFRSRDKFHSIFPATVDKNHFDLDHVLDKGSCPITAISLMNFVPSCSVCNEKLKKQKALGSWKKPIEELSPTSPKFDFDHQVEFVLMPKPGKKIGNRPTQQSDDYELKMDVKKPEYEHFIRIFHLRERYLFHKMEALFWLEIKRRYTDSRIAMIATALTDPEYTPQRIKEDIFQIPLDQRTRCFEKLKRDVLK